jgi:coiled-coil domain-containing protein 151
LEREIDKLRKINDEMKSKSARLRKELDTMRDAAKDLELDSQRPHMEDNEYTRRIRSLENKLDKAMIKYNEAQSIRKTYEQIVRRLSEERVGFDNQLAAIERTLGAKQKDYEELLLLSGDANHARETALGELERVRSGYEEERKRREKELRERHQMVQLRRQMLERMKYRERMRHQLASGMSGAACVV